ncbi:MAG: thiamine-phosphate synthase [Ferruginibacter sp.]|uniref:thiamine phosphate synthase n=1 Tax=Ferruginibacter sp. TaxID=1940288 RepID=UPI00265987E2|nr:thiamine phosphate synthase [Ferruginibacter sp.]MDB5280658.1 thiamine-phosphate synthase [Ferruginibacter sp.]
MFSKLQYISQGTTEVKQLNNIQQALDAGCNWIQLRFKNATPAAINALAAQVKEICASCNATFIINDHPQIAKEISADGVHLGLQDMPVTDARKITGDKIIGGTANTLDDVLKRIDEGCSYIGLGPFRFTTTKEKLSPVLGLEGYSKIMEGLNQRQMKVPVYAIGGIVLEDIAAIMQTGAYGVALSGIITHHSDKKLLLQQLNTLLYETVNDSE